MEKLADSMNNSIDFQDMAPFTLPDMVHPESTQPQNIDI